MDYNGVAVPLGGWCREPVYEMEAFLEATAVTPLGNGVCYNSKLGRPLVDSVVVSTVADCVAHAKGYTYFGMGCPHTAGIECWRGNTVNSDAPIAWEECAGELTTDIGNG